MRCVLVLLLHIVPEPVAICHFVRCTDQCILESFQTYSYQPVSCIMDRLCCNSNMDACHLFLSMIKSSNVSKHSWSMWACAGTHTSHRGSRQSCLSGLRCSQAFGGHPCSHQGSHTGGRRRHQGSQMPAVSPKWRRYAGGRKDPCYGERAAEYPLSMGASEQQIRWPQQQIRRTVAHYTEHAAPQ